VRCSRNGSKGFPAIKGIVITYRFQYAELSHIIYLYVVTRTQREAGDGFQTGDNKINHDIFLLLFVCKPVQLVLAQFLRVYRSRVDTVHFVVVIDFLQNLPNAFIKLID